MKTRLLISAIAMLFTITSTTGCDDRDAISTKTQEAYFAVVYANDAWVHQFRGFIVNKEGKVITFDKPQNWHQFDQGSELTPQQLIENLSKTTPSSVIIPAEEFTRYAAKVNSVSNADLSKPQAVGADGGSTSFYAFRLDKGAYKPVLLKQTGDVQIKNDNETATEMAPWLEGIMLEVY
ncbi:hypothetical protein [Dyadobacter sp. CY326]|uniref:hypothetical protein n=1 Tax=Dyadobacter sp. CY326 TaxID=2907300 RepID=UPI001F3D24DC|nr:hypothetical protein [Dyadobacter sp. CY326]MCE7067178.1 hypothetical protein [Dyadobacter sp. CY326]